MILIKSIFPSIKHPHITNTCNTEVSWHAWLHVKKLMPWLLYAFKLACFYATTGARSKSPSPTQKSTSLINTSKQFICLSWNCAVSVLCSCVFYLFIYLSLCLPERGKKKGKNAWCRKPSLLRLLPGGELGALREELGLGASLELQASVWLKAPSSCRRLWILLYSWRRFWKICSAGGKQETRKTGLKTYSHMLPTLRHLIVEMMVSVNYLEVFDANFKCPHLNSRISQLLFFAHRFVPGKNPAYFH